MDCEGKGKQAKGQKRGKRGKRIRKKKQEQRHSKLKVTDCDVKRARLAGEEMSRRVAEKQRQIKTLDVTGSKAG